MIFLKRGSKSRKDVMQAQHLINLYNEEHGWPQIGVDGIFGRETEDAVLRLQDGVSNAYSLLLHLQLSGRTTTQFISKITPYYNRNTPYIWGGKRKKDGSYNNKFRGLDCSGLATAVYSQFNPILNNAMHLYEKTERVNTPKIGDLVFYGHSKKRITHVCIVVDTLGGIVGMIGGGSRTTAPTPRACIKYLPHFAYRADVQGLGRPGIIS